MTQQKVKFSQGLATKYAKEGGQFCPFCENPDISGGSFEVEADVAWQSVSCVEGHEWQDVFLMAYVDMNPNFANTQNVYNPNLFRLNDGECSDIITALRALQIVRGSTTLVQLMNHIPDERKLTNEQIDKLCERINCGGND